MFFVDKKSEKRLNSQAVRKKTANIHRESSSKGCQTSSENTICEKVKIIHKRYCTGSWQMLYSMSVEKDAKNESFESAKTFWLKHKSLIVKEIKIFTKSVDSASVVW
jgi:hypothetical protein